ncbi:FkbM family methyltransferase [Stenotrophomonas sp. LGBM10]|uniref:FkbM family methyltransferase n=1 Tax=Stenotrophomonas sp. LGBM10 TaxID=3390038 RepID=UPI00398AB8D4
MGNAVRNAADMAAQSRASDGYLAPGEEVVLSSSPYSSMDAVTMRGFALPETDGIWSSGAVSTIDVRLRDVAPDRRYRVVMGALAFDAAGHRALVSLGINGGPSHQVLANDAGWSSVSADCEVRMIGKVPMIRIEFQVANPMSPTALSLGDDNRLLGFKIRSLQFVDIGPAAVVVAEDPALAIPQEQPVEAAPAVDEGSSTMERLTQSPTETIRELAKRGPVWRMVLLDKNPVVRVVRWMRRVSRNLSEMRYQLDQIRIDSARQTRELAERVDNIEIDARVQERERQKAGSDVDAIIQRLELNHARLLAIEESAQQVERLQEASRSEHADNLETIVATTDGLGRDVAVVLDTLNKTLGESVRLLREFESVDTKLAGMDQALRRVQQQGEEHARHAITGIRELREQLHLSLQQQHDRATQSQTSIESSLQSVIERQWADGDELRRHLHTTLQQMEERHEAERERLRALLQETLEEGVQAMDARPEVDVDAIHEHLIALRERVDGLGVVARGAPLTNESAAVQALHLVGLVHQKLDNGEIEVGQMLELLLSIKQRVDAQQTMLDSITAGQRPAAAPRRVLRRHDGWIIATEFGSFSCSESDDLLAMCLLDSGDVERGLRLFLEHALKAGDVFVDAGANIGLHTVAAAHAVGADGSVIAIEAMPRTLEHLKASLRLSGVEPQVTVLPVALGAQDEDGRAFHVGAVAGHSSLYPLDEEVETVLVDVRTLDGLLGEQRIDLVKIDVEGAELDVLAGMEGLLAANPAVGVVAEYAVSHLGRAGTSEADWEAFRVRHGFDLYRIDDLTGVCRPVEAFAALRGEVSSNILLCRPGSALPATMNAGAPA